MPGKNGPRTANCPSEILRTSSDRLQLNPGKGVEKTPAGAFPAKQLADFGHRPDVVSSAAPNSSDRRSGFARGAQPSASIEMQNSSSAAAGPNVIGARSPDTVKVFELRPVGGQPFETIPMN